MRRGYILILFAALFSALSEARQPVRGAGSTLHAPLYEAAISDFQFDRPGDQLTYKPAGSEKSVSLLLERKVDFAATDWPTRGNGRTQIPIAADAVVIIYNVPGVRSTLRFSPDVLARIFAGKIRKWNDPYIRSENPGMILPSAEIVPVHRSEGSGTTNIFVNFLAKLSTNWQGGNGSKVKWANWSTKAIDDEGVVLTVREKENSIGYTGYNYAIRLGLDHAYVQNKAGRFVRASINSISAAVPQTIAKDTEQQIQEMLPLAQDEEAYPISGFTWLVVSDHLSDQSKRVLSDFLRWMLDWCQVNGPLHGYIPLPQTLVEQDLEVIDQIGR